MAVPGYPRWLGWHVFVIFAAWGMLWLGDWQFHRAESRQRAELGIHVRVAAVCDIRRGVLGQDDPRRVPAAAGDDAGASRSSCPAGAGPALQAAIRPAGRTGDEQDPELAAYNAYLARLNEQVKGHGRWHGLR